MDELETLLQTQFIENKVIALLYEKVKQQGEEIESFRKQQEKEIEFLRSAVRKEAEFLTEGEAIEFFKTSRTTLWRLVSNNKLAIYKHGKRNRYKYEDLELTFSNPQNFQYGRLKRN